MSEFTSNFWSGWIIGLTVLSVAMLLALLYAVYFTKDTEEESVVWDGDLREGAAAPPWWWFFLLLALIIFSCVYLVLYPGLGKHRGVLEWTQAGELAANQERWREKFSAPREQWAHTPIAELAADAPAMRSAGRIYQNNCAACHGADARGQAKLFPDLLDDDWLWGGAEAQIEQSLRAGRQAIMPPWGAILKEDDVTQIIEHLQTLSDPGETEGGVSDPSEADGGGAEGGVAALSETNGEEAEGGVAALSETNGEEAEGGVAALSEAEGGVAALSEADGGEAEGGVAALSEADGGEAEGEETALSEADGGEHSPGQVLYLQYCGACHGAEGGGNPLLGAANLRDEIWLYGSSVEAVRTSITHGRRGIMPAQAGRLDDVQIRLLTAWLSGGAQTVSFGAED